MHNDFHIGVIFSMVCIAVWLWLSATHSPLVVLFFGASYAGGVLLGRILARRFQRRPDEAPHA